MMARAGAPVVRITAPIVNDPPASAEGSGDPERQQREARAALSGSRLGRPKATSALFFWQHVLSCQIDE